MEVLLLQEFVRCEVIQTVIFVGDGLFGLIIQVALFLVRRLALLCGWVCTTTVSVGAGLVAALTPPLWLLFGGATLRCVIPFFLVDSFGCVHHVYIVGWGGCPVPCGRWFLFASYIVIHAVDVFGVEVKHVG